MINSVRKRVIDTDLRKKLIFLVGTLSVGAGFLYLFGNDGLFNFLGAEAGSEGAAVQFWGKISVGLGMILLATMLLRAKMNERVNDGQLILFLSLLFVIQLPPVGLWLMFLIAGNAESIVGATVHILIIVFIARTITLGSRNAHI